MSKKVNALKNLDAIIGGTMSGCHKPKEVSLIKVVKPGDVRKQ